jgi:CRISPR system Cascade subunit CasE
MDMSETPKLYISAIHAPADSQFSATAAWDYYKVHQLVCTGFPDRQAAREARILFRFDIEGDTGFLFVQSKTKPDWSRLDPLLKLSVVGPKECVMPPAEPGTRLRFRLLARPSMRVGDKASSDRGRRLTLTKERDQRDWLDRKGAEHGFTVEICEISGRVWHDGKKGDRLPNGTPKPILATLFDGILVVADPVKIREAVASGIGAQKAYGFGLLSVALETSMALNSGADATPVEP